MSNWLDKNRFRKLTREEKQNYNKYLSVTSNWTPLLVYVHRSRLTYGLLLGFISGIILAILVTVYP